MSELDSRLLHELIVASSKANDSIKSSLTSMGESMEALVDNSSEAKEFIKEMREERKSFYKYFVKGFLWVFVIQLIIIGTLLWKLNVTGADTIIDVSSSAMKLMK